MVALTKESKLLYRVIFTSECVGTTGRSALSVAQILGISERNNRRDEIGAVMLFHAGRVAQMVEGMRTDVDRLLARLASDGRHRDLKILDDRPIVQRRLREPMHLCALSTHEVEAATRGRSLDMLDGSAIESLLTACQTRRADAA